MKLSVILLAYNEAENILPALNTVERALRRVGWIEYEIILVNDGSKDSTGQKIYDLSTQRWPVVVGAHLVVNKGPGCAFEAGLGLVTGDRVTCLGADNSLVEDSLVTLFEKAQKATFVLSYIANPQTRPWYRRWISTLYTLLWRTLFCIKVRYINGNAIYPAEFLKGVNLRANRHAYSAEITTKALRQGLRAEEIPLYLQKASGFSSALKMKVLLDTCQCLLWCLYDIYVGNRAAVVKWQTRWS